jgi:hypothetical protein
MWKVILAGGSFAGHVRVVPDPVELRERCYCEHKSAHGSHTGAVRFCSRKGRHHRPYRSFALGAKLQYRLTKCPSNRHKPSRPPRCALKEKWRSRFDDLGNKLRNAHFFQKTKSNQYTAMLFQDVPNAKAPMWPNVLSLKQTNLRLGQVLTGKSQGRNNAERHGPRGRIQDGRIGHFRGFLQPRGFRLCSLRHVPSPGRLTSQ